MQGKRKRYPGQGRVRHAKRFAIAVSQEWLDEAARVRAAHARRLGYMTGPRAGQRLADERARARATGADGARHERPT